MGREQRNPSSQETALPALMGIASLQPSYNRLLLRNFSKRLADWQHRVADQAGILDGGLAVLHRFAVDGIADHLGERRNAWIFGDEAAIPALRLGPDQHQFEPALPDDAAAEPFEHRAAFAPIGRIGFRARRLAAVGIGGLRAQANQIEHVDRTRPVIGPKLRKHFLGRIDVAHAEFPLRTPWFAAILIWPRRTS